MHKGTEKCIENFCVKVLPALTATRWKEIRPQKKSMNLVTAYTYSKTHEHTKA